MFSGIFLLVFDFFHIVHKDYWFLVTLVSSLESLAALVHEGGGSRTGEQGLEAMGETETALWRMASVNQLSFIPEYTKYIGLGILRTLSNFH